MNHVRQKNISPTTLIHPGTVFCKVSGDVAAILSGERLVLNFLQRLCGIATQTSFYARLARPFGIAVLDTRKTTPMLRSLEKYAVQVGGGTNHRFGLYDGVLVKDNHLQLATGFQPDFGAIPEARLPAGGSRDRSHKSRNVENSQRSRWTLVPFWDNMSPDMIQRMR